MLNLRIFVAWVTGHIEIKFIFILFASKNIIPPAKDDKSLIGYTDYFIFGIRIARIQKTKGWR